MQVSYHVPEIPLLLTVASFIYLLNVAEWTFNWIVNAGLIGSLVLGIIYGPQCANILPEDILAAFIILGYIGLLLLVMEAGLSTNFTQLLQNLVVSIFVALTGVGVPVALSIILLHFGFGFSILQSFAAGAALCSTSLGTTLALLRPDLRQTRAGSVLLSAALLDDIVGLIMAAIIPSLVPTDSSSGITWRTIVQPILVSLAFAVLTPTAALLMNRIISSLAWKYQIYFYRSTIQLFILISMLSGFVAGAKYAGTSELFGAYLCGTFLSRVFPEVPMPRKDPMNSFDISSSLSPPQATLTTPHETYLTYFAPPLERLLAPIFFASIGAALPIRSLGSVNGSSRVVWRGIVYSILMIIAKLVVGTWLLIWPEPKNQNSAGERVRSVPSMSTRDVRNGGDDGKHRAGSEGNTLELQRTRLEFQESTQVVQAVDPDSNRSPPSQPHVLPTFIPNIVEPEKTSMNLSRVRAATLLGTAMVARGEIALIIAQLGRPLFFNSSQSMANGEEIFAIVIWAILVSTIGGALAVGLLIRSWTRSSVA